MLGTFLRLVEDKIGAFKRHARDLYWTYKGESKELLGKCEGQNRDILERSYVMLHISRTCFWDSSYTLDTYKSTH